MSRWRPGRWRSWIPVTLAIGAVAAALAAGRFATEPRCYGRCDGTWTTCAGIDAWMDAVQRDEAWPRGGTSRLRGRIYRARIPFRGGRPCGGRGWGLDPVDPELIALVRRAGDRGESLTLTLRYNNPNADGNGVVWLYVIGAEVSPFEAAMAAWTTPR